MSKNKPQPIKQGDLVKLTNGMIDGFNRNQSIMKLRNLKGLRAELRYKIFRLTETIFNSPESKALGKTIEELVNQHNKSHEILRKELEKLETIPKESRTELQEKRINKLQQEVIPLQITAPEIKAVFNMESGLEINKLIVPTSQLSDEFTPFDMSACAWIIEFEE